MKKQLKKYTFLFALISFLTLSLNAVMAQRSGGGREQVDVLTSAQIKTVNTILSKYDSNSLTENDAEAIMKALKEARIPNGKGLETAITNAGFDPEKLKELAPRKRGGGRKG